MVYLPDHEPALGLPNGRWPAPDWISGYDLAFTADLLIYDAQYTDEEYASCVGWGHSTYRHAFEFAAQVGAKPLVPFHHDPSHDDDMLDRLLEIWSAGSSHPVRWLLAEKAQCSASKLASRAAPSSHVTCSIAIGLNARLHPSSRRPAAGHNMDFGPGTVGDALFVNAC